MILYFLPILFLFFLDITGYNQKRLILFLIYLMFFICFGYMSGSDWRSYEMIYTEIQTDNLSYFFLFYEPGFLLYVFLFKFLEIGFWEFHILTKIIIFWIFVFHLYKFVIRKRDIYLSLALFLSTAGYFFFIDCPFRNLIAWGISLFSFKYLFQRKIWQFSVIVLISSLFHTSMLFLIPIYWLSNLKFSSKQYVLIYLFILIVFYNKSVIMTLLYPISTLNPLLAARFDTYSENLSVSTAAGYSLGLLIQLVYLGLFIRLREKFVNTVAYGNILFNLTFLYFIFYRIALVIPVLSRLQFDLNIFYIVSMPFLIHNFTSRSKNMFKYLVYVISCLFIYVSVTSTTKYLPYTNYIYYKITGEDLSFEERSIYNELNSPYKKNE